MTRVVRYTYSKIFFLHATFSPTNQKVYKLLTEKNNAAIDDVLMFKLVNIVIHKLHEISEE